MNIYKNIKAGIMAVMMSAAGMASVFTTGTMSASAQEEIIYNANEIFAERTISEIADRYSQALYAEAEYNNEDYGTWYDEESSVEYPYEAGMIKDSTHREMITMTNFYRWLAGLDTIEGVRYSEEQLPMQTGALVRNFSWAHVVSDSMKPADMTDEMWNKGADCNHNILAKGYSPRDSVTAWLSEGYEYDINTWRSVGHRSVLLNPKLSEMTYGYSGSIAIGKGNTVNKAMDIPFTAYPVPGNMPANVINPHNCSWSVKLNSDMLEVESIDDVTVTIKNLATGETWNRTTADGTVIEQFELIAFSQPGDFTEAGYTDSYEVEITGINDIANNAPAKVVYTVNFFDIDNYAKAQVSSVDTCRTYMLAPEMMNEEMLNKVAAILPNEVEIVADNGQFFDVMIDGEWTLDMANSRFIAKATLDGVTDRLSDPYGLLNEISIPYAEKTGISAIYDTLDIYPQNAKPGEQVNFSVYRTNATSDTVNVFKLNKKSNGSYTSNEVYDSQDVNVKGSSAGVQDSYDVTATGNDNGEYISVYYMSEWLDGRYNTPIMVSNAVSTLDVECSKYDINGDGTENMMDAITLHKMVFGQTACSELADVNEDGRVNVLDMAFYKAYICRESC